MPISWPHDWQPDAIVAVEPYLGSDERLEIVAGPPTALDGSLLCGEKGVAG